MGSTDDFPLCVFHSIGIYGKSSVLPWQQEDCQQIARMFLTQVALPCRLTTSGKRPRGEAARGNAIDDVLWLLRNTDEFPPSRQHVADSRRKIVAAVRIHAHRWGSERATRRRVCRKKGATSRTHSKGHAESSPGGPSFVAFTKSRSSFSFRGATRSKSD